MIFNNKNKKVNFQVCFIDNYNIEKVCKFKFYGY